MSDFAGPSHPVEEENDEDRTLQGPPPAPLPQRRALALGLFATEPPLTFLPEKSPAATYLLQIHEVASAASSEEPQQPLAQGQEDPIGEDPNRSSLLFTTRIRTLAPVQILRRLYGNAIANPYIARSLRVVEWGLCLAGFPVLVFGRLFRIICKPKIACIDWTLCKMLDGIEMIVPCIRTPSENTLQTSYGSVSSSRNEDHPTSNFPQHEV